MPDHLLLPPPEQVGSRRMSGGGAGPKRDRSAHGQQLGTQLEAAAEAARRTGTGVDPNLVFKLHTSRRPADSGLEGRNLELLGETADYTFFVLSADQGTALADAINQYT